MQPSDILKGWENDPTYLSHRRRMKLHDLCHFVRLCLCVYVCMYMQGVSRLVDITAGGDFLGLYDKKRSYKHVSDFGRLRSYGHFLIPVHALV